MITSQHCFSFGKVFLVRESNYKVPHSFITSMFTDTAGLVTAQIATHVKKHWQGVRGVAIK